MAALGQLWLPVLVAPYLLGALAAAAGRRAVPLAHLFALLGGLVGAGVALAVLTGPPLAALSVPLAPFAKLGFRLDALSAWFLLLVSGIGAVAAVYALGYVPPEPHGHGAPPLLALGLNGFLAAMALVVAADSVAAFLIAWEAMSVVSFLLVVVDHHTREARRAGYIYVVMTHAGTAFILLAFLALGTAAGSFGFAELRAGAAALPGWLRDAAFALALVGFGTKAGLIPLHVWLPRAHPAAPSHVSALMSGVMLKTAVYGLLRVGWEFAGPGPAWWGAALVTLGAVSAVLGVLYALVERDLKRLLAFSSVENLGIVFLGLGAAFSLQSLGQPAAAGFALAAALVHSLNHAVFKSLLFLGAGAIHRATDTRDLERLGGLIHRMPATAAACLVGSAAISALPPLNGFAGEWLTFQALMRLGHLAGGVGAVGAALAVAALALTAGLAALTFVKAFGVAFLGVPRGVAAAAAREVNGPMRAAMGLLAGLCLLLGLVPGWLLGLVAPVARGLTGAELPALAGSPLAPIPAAPAGGGGLLPLGLLAAVGLAAVLGLGLARLLGGPGRSRVAPPWVCGVTLEPAMQYTSAALAKPIRLIFAAVLRPSRTVEIQRAASPHFVSGVRFEAGVEPVYEQHLYRRPVAALVAASRLVRRLQNGSLRLYLLYLFAALVAALLMTR